MHRIAINLLLPFLVLSGCVAAIGATHGTVPSSVPYACADSAEAADWREYLAPTFMSMDENEVEFRTVAGLQRVDSTAAVDPVTDPATCSAIAAAVARRHPVIGFPYHPVAVRFGPYYGVAIVDTSPPPTGLEMTGRTLVMILDAATLDVLHDNILM